MAVAKVLSRLTNPFLQSGALQAARLSAKRHIPSFIEKPPYAHPGARQPDAPKTSSIASPQSSHVLERIRRTSALAGKTLQYALSLAKVGVTTDEIDRHAHEYIIREGAYPSPLTYHEFPKSICTSVNEVACHGIPDDRALQEGDIVNIDVSVFREGVHGDCSETVVVGDTDILAQRLVDTARKAMYAGINVCGPGQPFHAIGNVIEDVADQNGYLVSELFCGHGIGIGFHEAPLILHVDNHLNLGVMLPGMTFTIEPVLVEFGRALHVWEDGWTAVTSDGGWSAQFEHTIEITEHGCDILTKVD